MVKKLISLILSVGIIFGLIFVISKITDKFNEDMKTIHPTYLIGGLDTNGEYEECKDKLVFEEIIKYDSIFIERDFDSKISYQIYYYDFEGNYLNSSEIIHGNFEDESDLTKFIRLVIIPEFSEDEDDEIKFYNKFKYTSDLTIKVKENKTSILEFALFNNNVPYRYKFEEGMSWEEFVNSEYNINSIFSISSTGMIILEHNGSKYSVTNESGLAISTASLIIPKVYVSTH